MSRTLHAAISAEVKAKLVELRTRSFADLQNLPEWSDEVTVRGKPVLLSVMKHLEPNWDILVLVRSHVSRWGGLFGEGQIDGFVMSPTGEWRAATESEIIECS